VLFGTDTNTESYNVAWSREWQERDQAILMNLCVGPENLARYFGGNLQRWLAGVRLDRRPVVSGQNA
jgi:hypothetical protein